MSKSLKRVLMLTTSLALVLVMLVCSSLITYAAPINWIGSFSPTDVRVYSSRDSSWVSASGLWNWNVNTSGTGQLYIGSPNSNYWAGFQYRLVCTGLTLPVGHYLALNFGLSQGLNPISDLPDNYYIDVVLYTSDGKSYLLDDGYFVQKSSSWEYTTIAQVTNNSGTPIDVSYITIKSNIPATLGTQISSGNSYTIVHSITASTTLTAEQARHAETIQAINDAVNEDFSYTPSDAAGQAVNDIAGFGDFVMNIRSNYTGVHAQMVSMVTGFVTTSSQFASFFNPFVTGLNVTILGFIAGFAALTVARKVLGH